MNKLIGLRPINIQLFAEKTPDIIIQEMQIKHAEELKKLQDEITVLKDNDKKKTEKITKLEEVNTAYYNKLIVQEQKQDKSKEKVEPEDDFVSPEELVNQMLGKGENK